MKGRYIFQQSAFILRFRYKAKLLSFIRQKWYSLLGMSIGKETVLPELTITWPHQVSIGDKCLLEPYTYFKFDGIWREGPAIRIRNNVFIGTGCEFNIRKSIDIGDDSLIASGCRFIDHDHGHIPGKLMRLQEGAEKEIIIENDVWLGVNVTVLKGVKIGTGAIVAAGAVVTKDILANEIWAGVPARKIGERGKVKFPNVVS